jgi:hypothetical protein
VPASQSSDVGAAYDFLGGNHTVLEITRSRCFFQSGLCNTNDLETVLVPAYVLHIAHTIVDEIGSATFKIRVALRPTGAWPTSFHTVVLRAPVDLDSPVGHGYLSGQYRINDLLNFFESIRTRSDSRRAVRPSQCPQDRPCFWALT